MNNKGQVIFFTFMIAIVIIVLALAFALPVKQLMDNTMSGTTDTSQGLDCTNQSISKYQSAQCLITDATTPFFIGAILAIAGLVIAAKVAFQ